MEYIFFLRYTWNILRRDQILITKKSWDFFFSAGLSCMHNFTVPWWHFSPSLLEIERQRRGRDTVALEFPLLQWHSYVEVATIWTLHRARYLFSGPSIYSGSETLLSISSYHNGMKLEIRASKSIKKPKEYKEKNLKSWDRWKRLFGTPKFMECSQCGSKKRIHSNTGLPREIRKMSKTNHIITLHSMELEESSSQSKQKIKNKD